MSRTHNVAWAAGFFDGEGFVSIQKRSHSKYIGYYLRIGCNHVAPEPLYELQKLFGGSVVLDKRKPKGNRKPRYRWCTSTKNAARALKQMLPYFRNKKGVAALALDFQSTIGKNWIPTSDEVQEYREWCFMEMQRLNSLD